MRLSHSSVQKYLQCPKKWQLHYQEKLRSTFLNSPLFFGSALDDAFGRLHLDKKKELTEEEQQMMTKTAEETYREAMQYTEVNGESVFIPTFENTIYSNADYDGNILTEEDREEISVFLKTNEFELDDIDAFFEEYRLMKRNKQEIDDDTRKVINYMSWVSLHRKGLLLLETYEAEIMPQIHEVFGIQIPVSLPNESGDTFSGYIDFVASFVDDPDTKVVCDDKTSAKAYPKDSVQISPQLAAYSEYMELEECAFIVAEKSIRKRDPKVRISILRGKVDDSTYEETFTTIDETLHCIKGEEFPKIMDQGEKCMFFGRKCEYYDFCRTESLKNLKYTGKK